jgi:hypothetical protein
MRLSPCQRDLFCVALPLVVACADATAPEHRVTVVVQSETVTPALSTAGSVNWMRFTLPLAIHNGSPRPIRFDHCTSAVDAPTGGEWRVVWTPICPLSASSPGDIQPGETREVTVTIIAAVDGPGAPRWDNDQIDGTYRFRMGLIRNELRKVIPVASNTFMLISSE